MSLPASFLPSVAFTWCASRVAALPLLTHAAAQAGCFERLAGQFILFVRCRLHKLLHAIELASHCDANFRYWFLCYNVGRLERCQSG
jgi:hypothetical protein